ncbi:MAG: ankyrin repeat domain-containing protein, partial [Oligoflexia bacterium]|nr:ankyrin repeat domain-containing protein [Oligoflexia bacterium]
MNKFILIICLSVFLNLSCHDHPYYPPALPRFIQAVDEDDMEEVKKLLAVESCDSEAFKEVKDRIYLTNKGICYDVNVIDFGSQESALFYVKSVKMAELLISKGADINIKTDFQETPLHTANNAEVAEFFIEKGLDIVEAQAKDEDEEKADTPLYSAVSSERFDVA